VLPLQIGTACGARARRLKPHAQALTVHVVAAGRPPDLLQAVVGLEAYATLGLWAHIVCVVGICKQNGAVLNQIKGVDCPRARAPWRPQQATASQGEYQRPPDATPGEAKHHRGQQLGDAEVHPVPKSRE